MIDYASVLEIFKCQNENIKLLEKGFSQINRAINIALIKNDSTALSIHTRLLALQYSVWAEAKFSKLIHTPYGFSPDEIQQIRTVQKQNGLEAGWKKCLELALRKVTASKSTGEIANIKQTISRLIVEYIIQPSILRNKIAHGQWKRAINRDFDKESTIYTTKLANLDPVIINKWKSVYGHISNLIEDLIESPNRAFRGNYWTHLTQLEEYLKKTESWTIEKKKQQLRLKQSYKKK